MRIIPNFKRQSVSTTCSALAVSLTLASACSVSNALANDLSEPDKNAESAVMRSQIEDENSGVTGNEVSATNEVDRDDSLVDGNFEPFTIVDIEPPQPGERRVVDALPGVTFALNDQSFDPATADFAVSGNDLVVITAEAGIVVLAGFFAESERPSMLRVLDGPPFSGPEMLERAEAAEAMPDVDQPARRRRSLWWRRR